MTPTNQLGLEHLFADIGSFDRGDHELWLPSGYYPTGQIGTRTRDLNKKRDAVKFLKSIGERPTKSARRTVRLMGALYAGRHFKNKRSISARSSSFVPRFRAPTYNPLAY